MLCRNPYIRDKSGKAIFRVGKDKYDGVPFGCGQCLPCLINKRRVWTLRLLLEFYQHDSASFVTLTYREQDMPLSVDCTPVLCKRHVQLFVKRLRKHFSGRLIRFYCGAEYTPKNHLPHYHLIIFGVRPDELDNDWFNWLGRSGPLRPGFFRQTTLTDLWPKGIVHVGEVTSESISYCAGYVTKKITRKGDGRVPEFQLMSRMPGIGLSALPEIARVMQEVPENCTITNARQVRVDGKSWPLGRYLLSKLILISDIQRSSEDYIRDLRTAYREAQQKHVDFLSFLLDQSKQTFRNLERKHQLFNQREALDELH